MMQQAQQMMQNPQMMQQMQQMMQGMGGGMGGGAPGANPFLPFGAMPPAANPGGADATNNGETANAEVTPTPMDRMRFAMQLQQLASMGFSDETKALAALLRCH